MSYGFSFKGNLGNACFSEKAPSTVFMGKATNSSSYSSSFYNRGCTWLSYYDYQNYHNYGYSQSCIGSGLSTTRDSLFYDDINWHHDRVDNNRTCVFEVESHSTPIVFIRYAIPATYGGLIIKIVDNGGTGPRGYPKWDITVWIHYTDGDYTAAANSLTLYCFSKMPPTYVNSSVYGLHIKDASGNTMFHSDFIPAQIKGILDISTSSTLSSWTGTFTEYNSISKHAYLSIDAGRVKRYLNGTHGSFEFHNPIRSFEKNEGNAWTAYEGWSPIFQINDTTGTTSYLGDTTLILPIIDGEDYD